MNDYINTNVTHVILRQFPLYSEMNDLKRFPCIVNFDFMSISVNDLMKVNIDKYFIKNFNFKNPLYTDCYTYNYKDTGTHAFSLLRNKREYNKSPYNHQIQIIPTHYKNTESWLEVLLLIMGQVTSDNHKINRLDVSFVNEYLTPGMVYYSTHFKWKKSVQRYTSVEYTRGMISGVRSQGAQTTVSCYSGASKECRSLIKKKIRKDQNNFEFQIKSKTLGSSFEIVTLFDIKKFIEKDKFFWVEFYDLTKTHSSLKEKDIKKFKNVQRTVLANGLNPTRYIFNTNKNFSRDYGKKLLVPLTINNGKARVSFCLKKRFNTFVREFDEKLNEAVVKFNDPSILTEARSHIVSSLIPKTQATQPSLF